MTFTDFASYGISIATVAGALCVAFNPDHARRVAHFLMARAAAVEEGRKAYRAVRQATIQVVSEIREQA